MVFNNIQKHGFAIILDSVSPSNIWNIWMLANHIRNCARP